LKILLCDPVDESIKEHFYSEDGVNILETYDRDSLQSELDDAHILVVRSSTRVDREIIEQGTSLIGIVRAGVGLDSIDLDVAKDHNITVENTPEASTNAVAELVIGQILSIYRSISHADREMKNGNWIKNELHGREIQNKLVGILGFGRIGRRIGSILSRFGAEIQAYDEYITENKIRSEGAEPVSFETLIRTSDVITVHVPLNSETADLIDTEEINLMKDDSVIINAARGGIINEEALLEAIESGELYGAGLDTYVTEPPENRQLISNKRVVSTPHIGASTTEAQSRIADLVIRKIENMR